MPQTPILVIKGPHIMGLGLLSGYRIRFLDKSFRPDRVRIPMFLSLSTSRYAGSQTGLGFRAPELNTMFP